MRFHTGSDKLTIKKLAHGLTSQMVMCLS